MFFQRAVAGRLSSPCIRGCFYSGGSYLLARLVFPVHTGVFLFRFRPFFHRSGLPRAYGGVSHNLTRLDHQARSSPCIRGCFLVTLEAALSEAVFPVHTGVFLVQMLDRFAPGGLPRAYGGVSSAYVGSVRARRSSPCIRGCFHYITHFAKIQMVFPVHTGVFLRLINDNETTIRLPRAYGGVSY